MSALAAASNEIWQIVLTRLWKVRHSEAGASTSKRDFFEKHQLPTFTKHSPHWQDAVGSTTSLAPNTFLTTGVYGAPGCPFHAFYWACFTVSTTSLPRPATLVLGPTSRFFDFSTVYSLMSYFARWEQDTGHSQPLMMFVTYLREIFLRWVMAAAGASTTMTQNPKSKLLFVCCFRFVPGIPSSLTNRANQEAHSQPKVSLFIVEYLLWL